MDGKRNCQTKERKMGQQVLRKPHVYLYGLSNPSLPRSFCHHWKQKVQKNVRGKVPNCIHGTSPGFSLRKRGPISHYFL